MRTTPTSKHLGAVMRICCVNDNEIPLPFLVHNFSLEDRMNYHNRLLKAADDVQDSVVKSLGVILNELEES